MSSTVEDVLARRKDTATLDLIADYPQDQYEKLWKKDKAGPRLYRTFALDLVKQGHPSLGLKLAREGLECNRYEGDTVLQYTVALAYARGGNLTSAEEALQRILAPAARAGGPPPAGITPLQRVDIVALRGRLYKEAYRREKDPAKRHEPANQAADWYLRAADLPGAEGWTLVNAATMRRLAGNLKDTRDLARRAIERVKADGADDYWPQATLGEAHLLLGELDKAREHYRAAADLGGEQSGDLVSMLGNLQLLDDAGVKFDKAALVEKLGRVVLFVGHRIDPPRRPGKASPPRFPNLRSLAEKVKAEIKRRLEDLNVRCGFCSLAAGSDVLFAEAMQERNAELHVVLPFAKEDFLTTSVDYGHAEDPGLQKWRDRFHAVLGKLRPDHLHYATEEPYLGTELLFEYGNTFFQGLGMLRAAQRLGKPVALAVLDPTAESLPGGTREFLDDWERRGLTAEVIDLAALRGDATAPPPAGRGPAVKPTPAKMPRHIRSMLFADVASFSKMKEELAPEFFRKFPVAVARALKKAGKNILLANTWGDGFFGVFEHVRECADFALELVAGVRGALDWKGMGFPDANPIRVGLHAGPVFELEEDPVLKRNNFFGQHVNRAARIEPVTMPGSAFASEQFAALLTMAAPDRFRLEEIGVQQLPKKSGVVALYRIGRA
jgi:class 3 adenylate cyclase